MLQLAFLLALVIYSFCLFLVSRTANNSARRASRASEKGITAQTSVSPSQEIDNSPQSSASPSQPRAKNLHWSLISIGMIASSLSGVTFLSQPAWVAATGWSYLCMVMGYLLGYCLLAVWLMPVLYNFRASIYLFLKERFGSTSYLTGTSIFIIARGLGAAIRVYVTLFAVHSFVCPSIPFPLLAILSMAIILLYSLRGGLQAIIRTDLLQAATMLFAIVALILFFMNHLGWDLTKIFADASQQGYTRVIITDVASRSHYLKQFFAGVFIVLAMTGLDQDMMQKSLSCRSLSDAKKNMYLLGLTLIPVNILILFLGVVAYLYAASTNLDISHADNLLPMTVLNAGDSLLTIIFTLGLVAANLSSADGTIAALSTIFQQKSAAISKPSESRRKSLIYISICAVFALISILLFYVRNQNMIDLFFTISGYLYGPLLGLFAFGMLTKYKIRDRLSLPIAILSPIITFFIVRCTTVYNFGHEILILNALITFLLLFFTIRR